MKRALILIFLLIVSYATVVVGRIQEFDALWYTGLGFGCAVALAIILGIVKMVWRFMARSITSILFVITSLAIVGVLSWFDKISAFVGYTIGTVFGIALFYIIFRKLAHWSERSMLFGEVFSFISNYKIRSYLTKDSIVDKETQIVYNVDFKNIVLVLKEQFGYPASEAKEAAQHVIAETPASKPIEEKIKEALKYLDTENLEIESVRRN